MNVSILAWLYYNKLNPDKYNDLDDIGQRKSANSAFRNTKTLKMKAFWHAYHEYTIMQSLDLERLLEEKTPK